VGSTNKKNDLKLKTNFILDNYIYSHAGTKIDIVVLESEHAFPGNTLFRADSQILSPREEVMPQVGKSSSSRLAEYMS
jgi:hypothetical protein